MAHQVAERLGVDIDVVYSWPAPKFERWVAYYNVKHEREKREAAKIAKQK